MLNVQVQAPVRTARACLGIAVQAQALKGDAPGVSSVELLERVQGRPRIWAEGGQAHALEVEAQLGLAQLEGRRCTT